MDQNKKKRHHYVWRYYLRKWATNEKIYCLMNGSIFQSNLMGIAQEKYFYKLKELSQRDIEFIQNFIKKQNSPALQLNNLTWLNLFKKLFEIQKEKSELSSEEFDERFEIAKCNFEEEIHCFVEDKGKKYLDKLYEHDISFWSTVERMSFSFYIFQQYARTSNMQNNAKSNMDSSFDFLNIDAVFPVLRHIISTTMAFQIAQSGYSLVLFENNTAVPFITGDQPVINTFAVHTKHDEEVKDLELYYPISPNLAILITDQEKFRTGGKIQITESEVEKLNNDIFKCSAKQIYADNKKSLIKYIDVEGL